MLCVLECRHRLNQAALPRLTIPIKEGALDRIEGAAQLLRHLLRLPFCELLKDLSRHFGEGFCHIGFNPALGEVTHISLTLMNLAAPSSVESPSEDHMPKITVGDSVTIEATVSRVSDDGSEITVRLPHYGYPVTIPQNSVEVKAKAGAKPKQRTQVRGSMLSKVLGDED
ncbi:hypothetical protein [Pelagibacterium sp. H642]|uniref:hypothetical protein n=1 Tax=Pelagibacterium sp. H642 TaxID=1881069 RepID=UPI002815B273|nr:hypothetical protein [Pelagibacterium sp. H642]WMT90134.1 hypothetical protein NO934_15250 [Pelagibacterium sp. H642]